MLDNLKLGSTNGTLQLTPADSNVASNFTLPQLTTTGNADYDNPGAYGPIPGDTGTGSTNYGYLYNWSAATAGESRTSHPNTAGDAPYSICPANWRLPTASVSGDYSALDIAWGGTGEFSHNNEPNISKWQHDGPFKGVFAGYWWEDFYYQGDNGGLWSASAFSGGSARAHLASLSDSAVNPVNFDDRNAGFSVRCILQ